MNGINYYFLPSARQGLAADLKAPARGVHRASIGVSLRLQARAKGGSTLETVDVSPSSPIQLLGPGDILGFQPNSIVRTDPNPGSGDFEPNYFPAIEFVDADFVWRFTADIPGPQGLMPWIALIVLVAESRGDSMKSEFLEEPSAQANLPRLIRVADSSVLPNLAHAWRWAHVQVAAEPGLDKPAVAQMLRERPEMAVSRLVCPRRLREGTGYAAFVVPTFRLGVLAGLGQDWDPSVDVLTPAWNAAEGGEVVLPYYHRWNFQTSLKGDFESLVRLLKPRTLSGLGTRDINCASPGYGVPGVVRSDPAEAANNLGLEGALKSVDVKCTPWGRDPADRPLGVVPDTQRQLAALIKKPDLTRIQDTVVLQIEPTASISAINAKAAPNCTEIHFTWTTTEPMTSEIRFAGPDGIWVEMSDPSLSTSHSLTLSKLAPGRTYQCILGGAREDGTISETQQGTVQIPLPVVVPPIYGRWHFGQKANPDPDTQECWIDVLNLDPRHRVAAGMGAEVVRRQQEPLMASAWDQLGAIEEANDMLRRAQLGREGSGVVYARLGQLPSERFLGVTAAVQRRVVIADPENGTRMTASVYLSTRTRIPDAVLDPFFRRLNRPRGPIRRRRTPGANTNLLGRLVAGQLEPAGPSPIPAGMIQICDVSKLLRSRLVPSVTLKLDRNMVSPGSKIVLSWISSNGQCIASGAWSGSKIQNGSEVVLIPLAGQDNLSGGATGTVGGNGTPDPLLPLTPTILVFSIACKGPGGIASTSVAVSVMVPGQPGIAPPTIGPQPAVPAAWTKESLRFCDGSISSAQIAASLANEKTFSKLVGRYDPKVSGKRVQDALSGWLGAPSSSSVGPPIRGAGFISEFRNILYSKLNPKSTFVERARKRLQLSDALSTRFNAGSARDPLDPIMSAPYFPQPMYEALRDLSHEMLLPGVEAIPQETICVLETNRRFIESYMCGLNHEFAGELLWREYPTDQRGSYFRQFWDVSDYVPRANEDQSTIEERLRDIAPLVAWRTNRLGGNPPALSRNAMSDTLVLLIRGQLLLRYPNALVYAVDAVLGAGGKRVPGLAEYLRISVGKIDGSYVRYLDQQLVTRQLQRAIASVGISLSRDAQIVLQAPQLRWQIRDATSVYEAQVEEGRIGMYRLKSESPRIWPTFKGSLPPDVSFLGFPFTVAEARGDSAGLGKYLILEERVGEPRFGLDPASSTSLETWDDLSWSHFGLGDAYGAYLDKSALMPIPRNNPEYKRWDANASSATRAWITLQRPIRVAVHAAQMLP